LQKESKAPISPPSHLDPTTPIVGIRVNL